MQTVKLIITEYGDTSVGIQDQSWTIECPFVTDDDKDVMNEFKESVIKMWQDYCGGKVGAYFNFENIEDYTHQNRELFVDSHNGVYSWQYAWNKLDVMYKKQAVVQMNIEYICDLKAGPDSEFYNEASDALELVLFKTPDGKFFRLEQDEDIWLIWENEVKEDAE